MPSSFTLSLLPDTLAVCRLEADAAVPGWATAGRFWSLTRTAGELSIVCAEEAVPAGVRREGGWRALTVEGPLDLAMVGVLAALTVPLADAGVTIFAVSTYDTDYLLLRESDLPRAVRALTEAGHAVRE